MTRAERIAAIMYARRAAVIVAQLRAERATYPSVSVERIAR
jgi:hypothetical protein